MDDNKKEKKDLNKKTNQDEEIEKAKKEMEELMKSISEEVGGQNVKVVQLQIPRANFKNFLFTLFFGLLLNTLLIIGTSGFFEFVKYENILNLVLFSVYFTFLERILDFLFLKFFTPIIITLLITLLFPIFVIVDNVFLTLVTIVFIHVCKGTILKFIQTKFLFRKMRRKK